MKVSLEENIERTSRNESAEKGECSLVERNTT